MELRGEILADPEGRDRRAQPPGTSVDADRPPVPHRHMDRLAVATDERPHLRSGEPEQVRGLDEDGVQGDDAPAEPVAAGADALQQPADGEADQQLVRLRLGDLQLVRDRGRAPLRGVDREQIEHPVARLAS